MIDRQTPEKREETARRMAIEGAGRIRNYLFSMRDGYAADRSIGVEKAALWCDEALLHLHENGILVVPEVPPEIAAMKMPGDSWRAFQVFEIWLMATRGACTFEQAFTVLLKRAPKPGDVFLMIAIANAFGKSERWLNATEEMLRQARKAAKSPRPGRRDPLRERMKEIFCKERKAGHSLDEALHGWKNNQIDGLRLTYDRENNVYVVDDEDAVEIVFKTFTDRQLRTIFTESILPG